LPADFVAGLTGAIIVLPQGVAFATIAGMPPEYGLYAAIVPTIVAALFGSSWHLVAGPSTTASLVLATALAAFAEPGSAAYVKLAITLAFMVGLMELSLGILRLGALVNFISHSVIVGFTAGVGIIIIITQIRNFIGMPVPQGLPVHALIVHIATHLGDGDLATTLTGLITLTARLAVRHRLRGRLEVALMAPRTADEYQAVLKRAIAESETIVDTFNGILKIARIKAGALALPHAPVNLVEVAEELADLYQAFAEEEGVIVEARSSPEKAVYVLGDAHLISQAAANLLDNAIKYSPKGGRVVVAVAEGADGASLTVADSGPGIPKEKRTAILDRFVRLESAAGKQGFGLGLSFAAAVAEWHGARLELEDNMPGLRATLHFSAAHI
jgi:SulP family sulfate permease